MILTCPNCSTRYLMSAAAIGEKGRDVRCAKCAHEWFQPGEVVTEVVKGGEDSLTQPTESAQPEEDINVEDRLKDIASQIMDEEGEEENFEDQADGDDEGEGEQEPKIKTIYSPGDQEKERKDDIPDSVKPDHKENPVPAFAKDVRRPEMTLQAKLTGYGAALVVFALVVVSMLIFQKKIINAWPPAIAIYELAGLTIPFKGEALILENLAAEVVSQSSGADILVLKGRVINLTDRTIDVPRLIAVLRNTNGDTDGKWLIEPPVDSVEAGASFTFTSEYAGIPRGVGSVNLTFAPELIDG